MIHKIENEEDLKGWCREVNSGNHKHLCDLQDVYARSDEKTIIDIFLAQEMNEKELTIFAVQKGMGSEKMFRLMKSWARQQAEICIEENEGHLAERFKELNEARRTFELEKTAIGTQNKGYADQIETQSDILERARTRINELSKENAALYLRGSELETELEEAYRENEKHNQFRSYLRETLIPITA